MNVKPRRGYTDWSQLPLMLTVAQTGFVLNVSENTVLKDIHDGRLPAFRVGVQWRISKEDLAAFCKGIRH